MASLRALMLLGWARSHTIANVDDCMLVTVAPLRFCFSRISGKKDSDGLVWLWTDDMTCQTLDSKFRSYVILTVSTWVSEGRRNYTTVGLGMTVPLP
jgi:hypothetical protein